LIRKQPEAVPMRVAGRAEAGEAVEESGRPHDIAAAYGEGHVVELNCEETAEFAEILNRPA
jgi:hypothetical protein